MPACADSVLQDKIYEGYPTSRLPHSPKRLVAKVSAGYEIWLAAIGPAWFAGLYIKWSMLVRWILSNLQSPGQHHASCQPRVTCKETVKASTSTDILTRQQGVTFLLCFCLGLLGNGCCCFPNTWQLSKYFSKKLRIGYELKHVALQYVVQHSFIGTDCSYCECTYTVMILSYMTPYRIQHSKELSGFAAQKFQSDSADELNVMDERYFWR